MILNQIVSPYGISILSTFIFMVAWLFPGHLYSQMIREPDLMFLDPEVLLFFLLCVAGFWVGLLLIDVLFPGQPLLETRSRRTRLSDTAVIIPLILTTLMTLLACVQLFRETPNLLVLLLSQQGAVVKSQLTGLKLGVLGWGADIQQPVIWWTYWRLRSSKPKGSGAPSLQRRFYWSIFAVGVLGDIALCILQVSRDEIMPLFGGLAVIYLMGKIHRREVKTPGLLRYLVVLLGFVFALFVLLALMRGTTDISAGMRDFVGYTLASYNRLTALVHGTMHYPYGGRGIYLLPFLNSNHIVNTVFPVNQTLGWPDFYELWHSEFVAPQLAGLNDYLIWSSAFGYLFADCGWLTPIVLAGYGITYSLVWRQAKSATALGLTLYPWFAFSALAWFSTNRVFNANFPFCVAAGLLLLAYEKVLS